MEKRKVAIVGASIGGMVAAAELRGKGFEVTILEKGRAVGGLYGKVDTPFGSQELGMHVLYLAEAHYRHLTAIFGSEAFDTWTGTAVDIGSNYNFGKGNFGSVYPDIRGLPNARLMLNELVAEQRDTHPEAANAFEAATRRFGRRIATEVYAPILQKLWKTDANKLSPGALHCFFDLRRVVACDKREADRLKQNSWLDAIIANPVQQQPAGAVFGGRMAARFRDTPVDPSRTAEDWLGRSGISIRFDQSVEIINGQLMLGGMPMHEIFDACIVATPLPTLLPIVAQQMEALDLSVYYFKLAEETGETFPAYYMVCHAPELASSRVVNYGAYTATPDAKRPAVVSVEVAHVSGRAPEVTEIEAELQRMLPAIKIEDNFKLPRSLRVSLPTVSNACLLNEKVSGTELAFKEHALFFTGMRPDKGVFFSHHTIGLAYEAAVECAERFA